MSANRWGFEMALAALKNGSKVRREHWAKSGCYVQRDPEDGVLTHYSSFNGHPTMIEFEADSEELLATDWETLPE